VDILLEEEPRKPAKDEPPPSIWQRIRAKLPELIFETVCIAISILLALGVGEMAEQAREKRFALKALANFKEELQSNSDFMKQAIPLHKEYIRKLEAIRPPINSWTDIDRQIQFRGLGPSSAYSTAWDTAVATNVLKDIDYDTVKTLSRVYLRQGYVESVRQKFLDVFYNPVTYHNENAIGLVQSMHIMFLDLARVEENVVKDYEETLRVIEERYPGLQVEVLAGSTSSLDAAPTLAPEAGQ
jgi:hypothetical protein